MCKLECLQWLRLFMNQCRGRRLFGRCRWRFERQRLSQLRGRGSFSFLRSLFFCLRRLSCHDCSMN